MTRLGWINHDTLQVMEKIDMRNGVTLNNFFCHFDFDIRFMCWNKSSSTEYITYMDSLTELLKYLFGRAITQHPGIGWETLQANIYQACGFLTSIKLDSIHIAHVHWFQRLLPNVLDTKNVEFCFFFFFLPKTKHTIKIHLEQFVRYEHFNDVENMQISYFFPLNNICVRKMHTYSTFKIMMSWFFLVNYHSIILYGIWLDGMNV